MKKFLIILLFPLFIFSFAYASDLTSTNFIIRDPIVGTGGDYSTSTNFKMFGSGNTLMSGVDSSSSFIGHYGFLYFPYVTVGTLTATPVGAQVDLSWGASVAGGGWSVSGYNTGKASVSGGPYAYTAVGNVTSYSYTQLAPGEYCFVVQTLDALGYVIGTSNESCATVSPVITFDLDTTTLSIDATNDRVGVGTTAPTANLHVQGNTGGIFYVYGSNGSNAVMQLYEGGTNGGWNGANAIFNITKDSGTNRSINAAGSINASGADYAEWMKVNDPNLEAADVVALNNEGKLVKTGSTEAVSLIGIISTQPAFIGNDGDSQNSKLVALMGQVPVKFSNENGEVKPGDRLTVSKTKAGYAMKMTASGQSIGIALESSTMSIDGKVLAFVNLGYQDMNKQLSMEDYKVEGDFDKFIADLKSENAYNPVDFIKKAVADGAEVVKDFVTARITAVRGYFDEVFAKKLCLEDVCIDKNQLKELLEKNGISNSTNSSVINNAGTPPAETPPDLPEGEVNNSVPVPPPSGEAEVGVVSEPAPAPTPDPTPAEAPAPEPAPGEAPTP